MKELNEILFSLPIGLKYNLTLMPIIYKSVLESLQNKQEIKGMSTLQQWNIALSSLIDIYNPVFQSTQHELSSNLFEVLNYHFNNDKKQMGIVFKIISKLGAKCRHYKDDKPVRFSNADDGLVLYFRDKHTGKQIKLGIDFIITTITSEILERAS